MIDSHAFFHMFKPDFGRVAGVVCSSIVPYSTTKTKAALDERIASRLEKVVFSFTAADKIFQFNFVCRNPVEAEEKHKWIQGLNVVQEASMGIIRRFVQVTDRIDDERRISSPRFSRDTR